MKPPFRKIIHIDMDAFYAAVEQRDFPELRGKPIAVGGTKLRGVVSTASYEARAFGVHSAMPSFQAVRCCPQLIFVPPRFEVYKEVSQQIRHIFQQYTELIEPLSLDEAYLDVSDYQDITYAQDIAKAIRADIYKETALTASAGISYCKFLAKVASDINKPNGQKVIHPEQALSFLAELPIEKFHGIGKVTALKMQELNIKTGADLKEYSKLQLAKIFGKAGIHYYNIVRGIDQRAVNPHRIRKSIAYERTFAEILQGEQTIKQHLKVILEQFYLRLSRLDNFGRSLSLKIKDADFKIYTRSHSKSYFIKSREEIEQIILQLYEEHKEEFPKIRLIGITASNLEKAVDPSLGLQLSFDFD